MNQNIPEEIKIVAKQASNLSQQALEAYREGNAELSRNLMKDAVMASKKCQVLIYELQKAKAKQ
jgi:RNase P subunit RPR2